MNNNTPTIREILGHLDVQRLVSQKELMRIDESLDKSDQTSKDPIYMHILLGFGAWFAALFLISFCGMSHIFEDKFLTTFFGIIFLVAAIFITRVNKATFFSQLSLALAFSGNIMVLIGIANGFGTHELSVIIITQAIICVIVYPFYDNAIYRFLAPTALAVLITTWIITEKVFFLIHALVTAEAFLVGTLLFYRKRPHLLTPLIYSSAIMLPITLLLMNISQVCPWRENFDEPLWPSSILLAGSLIYLYLHLAGGLKRLNEPWLVLAILSTILLGFFTTPGILVAIGLLVAGYTFGNRILTVLSYLFLPCFLIVFYYALNIDLAYKSWVVAGSGVILLVIYWIVKTIQPEEVSW